MFIIAGLGNPTLQYEGTRHNVGFEVIDALADKYNISVNVRKNRAYIGKGMVNGRNIILDSSVSVRREAQADIMGSRILFPILEQRYFPELK